LAAHGGSKRLAEVAAYGEVVWSWHPLLMSSRAEAKPAQPGEVADHPLGDGDKKEFVAEESTKETVKTIARGKPGDFRRNRGDYRVLPTNAHGLRVLRAPGFPCSLFSFEGQTIGQTSGNPCRENADAHLLFENGLLRFARNDSQVQNRRQHAPPSTQR
jgi:hypothetical protein